MEEIYEFYEIWDFQWTALPATRESFARLDIPDRNFIIFFGSMFLFLIIFIMVLILQVLLPCCTNIKVINKIYLWIKLDEPIRLILIGFYLGVYIDLLMGCLINTENAYLFSVPSNWGPNGNLTFSD